MQKEVIWLDANNKKVNHDQIRYQPDVDGTAYRDGLTPEQLFALGYQEITIEVRPDDFSDKLYFRTEQDDAPYVVYSKKSDEAIAAMVLADEAQAAQQHLDSTDYLFTIDRNAELVTNEPERAAALVLSREAARQKVREWKDSQVAE